MLQRTSMQLRFLFCGILTFTTLNFVLGQQDSVLLESVTISAPKYTQYAAGSKVLIIESADTLQNLNDQLSGLPSVVFKNYGNYQLSSIAMRGTSASHTLLLWNGIPVNSPTLGQGDFSLFPSYLMDDVAVLYGNGSAMVGSGAIGGSVSMDYASPLFDSRIGGSVSLRAASFGHYFGGAKVRYSNENWAGVTKLFRRSIKNDFEYPLKGRNITKKQNNAAVLNYGFEQQLHYKLSEKERVGIVGMYTFNHREIQPAVTNNGGDDTLLNENARFVLDYVRDAKFGTLNIKGAYVLNDQFYNVTSRVKSEQWSGVIDYNNSVSSKTTMRVGTSYNYLVPKVDSYQANASENRTDGYLSVKHHFSPKLIASLNLRQSLYDGELAPFTPSIGQEWRVLKSLTLRNTISRAYRIPTLNDRFWYQGGNPDIIPEESYGVEFGALWQISKKTINIDVDATYYYQNVNNWIIWLPDAVTSYYTAMNIRKVEVNGVEFSSTIKWTSSIGEWQLKPTYSYTKSVNQNGLNASDFDSVDKQLPYVPVHSSFASLNWSKKQWKTLLSANYTGKRYVETTNDEFQALKGFVLCNALIHRVFSFNKQQLIVSGEVNNIFNTYYEQLKNHAMPGRNYAINISINI